MREQGDMGFDENDRSELDEQRDDILKAFPRTKALISFVVRMNREPIRTPAARSPTSNFTTRAIKQEDTLKEVVKPLQEKEETIYVLKNSDAEDHVAKRFPNKRTKHVGNSLRPSSISGFLQGVPLVFQPGKSAGLNATYHFTFTGDEDASEFVAILGLEWTEKGGTSKAIGRLSGHARQ